MNGKAMSGATRATSAMSQPFSAGGLVSTVDDLALWNTAIDRGRLLSESSRARWYTPFTLTSGRSTGYALGWSVTKHEGLAVAEHGGGINGFRSWVVRIPSERVYVAVLSNNGASRPGTVARQLAALAIGRPFKDPLLAVVPVPTLEEYVGKYKMADGEADQRRDRQGQTDHSTTRRAVAALALGDGGILRAGRRAARELPSGCRHR